MRAAIHPPLNATPASAKVLGIVLFAALLTTLNTAIVNVALSGIREGLGFTASSISWVINAYLLTYGGFLIVGGRLGDVLGRRRTLLAGLVLFMAGSFGAGAAWSPSMLIAGRAVQGLGAALTAPSVLATITHLYHGDARTRALSWFSVVIGVGLSLGMVLGGVILQWLSWRWIFWLNLPVGAVLSVLVALCLPAMRSERRHRLDLVGAVLAMSTTVGVVFAFVQLAGGVDHAAQVGLSLTGAAIAFVGLRLRLRHASEPLVPLSLFTRRTAVGAIAVNGLLAAAMAGLVFFLSQLFSRQLRLGPLGVGALFLVFTVPQLASALSAGRLMRRREVRVVVLASLVVAIVGMLLIAASTTSTTVSAALLTGMTLAGIGAGGVFLGANLIVMSTMEAHMAGAASGVLQTSVQLGSSIGIALLVLIRSLAGFAGVFVGAAVLLCLAMLATCVRDRPDPALARLVKDADSSAEKQPAH